MSVIEWICDCCGAYLTQFNDRFIVQAHLLNGREDCCEDCIKHDKPCHEYIRCECPEHQEQNK